MRILIVEDDFITRRLLMKLLSPYGTCNLAVNGLQGVEAFREALESDRPFDLVCLDIMMPVMNGHDALKEIRKLEAEKGVEEKNAAKIIMITAANTQQDVVKAGLNKCDGYLLKPIDKNKLRNTLKSFGFERDANNTNTKSGK